MYEIMTLSDIKRFWDKVDKHGPVPTHRPELGRCWLWLTTEQGDGYGQFWLKQPNGNRKAIAHVLMWEIDRQKRVPKGKIIRHRCDRRRCINPSHLKSGSCQDNTNDMVRHDRESRGEKHYRCKLSTKEVRKVVRLYIKGMLPRRIGKKFGVSKTTIMYIVSGKSRKKEVQDLLDICQSAKVKRRQEKALFHVLSVASKTSWRNGSHPPEKRKGGRPKVR